MSNPEEKLLTGGEPEKPASGAIVKGVAILGLIGILGGETALIIKRACEDYRGGADTTTIDQSKK